VGGKPTSSKPGTSGDKVTEAYQDLLKEIVDKKKATVEAAKRRPKKRPKGALLKATLAVILPPVVAAIWIFKPFDPAPPGPVRPPDEAVVWQTTLLSAARRVADWRDSAGYLPLKLEATGVLLPGVTYEVSSDSAFVLRSFAEDRTVSVYVDGALFGIDAPPRHPAPPEAPFQ
jgi:hypothetical protein